MLLFALDVASSTSDSKATALVHVHQKKVLSEAPDSELEESSEAPTIKEDPKSIDAEVLESVKEVDSSGEDRPSSRQSSSSSVVSVRSSSSSETSVISVATVEDQNGDHPTHSASPSLEIQAGEHMSIVEDDRSSSATRSTGASSSRSAGMTSPYANNLVHNVLLRVINESDDSVISRSPTSPLAEKLVEAALVEASGPSTSRSEISDVTIVTPREPENISTSTSDTSSSSSESSDSEHGTN